MKAMRKPSVAALVARVLVVTMLATLLTLAVFLFVGIAGIVLLGLIRGHAMDITYAYRHIALPAALTALVLAFIAALWGEVRRYRLVRAELKLRAHLDAA